MGKNKAKFFSNGILSAYIGRFLTAIVAFLVFGITASALISTGGETGDGVLRIGVFLEESDDFTLGRYEAFRNLISSQIKRSANLYIHTPDALPADLYILSLRNFLRIEKRLDLVPLFAVDGSGSGRDAAVIITADSSDEVDFGNVPSSRVAFTDSLSVNGFWLQLMMLERKGFHVPEQLDQLNFEGSGFFSVRLVQGVRWGAYTLGACQKSDLISLIKKGLLRQGEVRILAETEWLPEILIASPRQRAEYNEEVLGKVRDILSSPAYAADGEVTTILHEPPGVTRLAPIDAKTLKRMRELAEYQAARF